MTVLRVAGAQLRNVVGDIDGNAERILAAMRWAEREQADVLVLPELALTGYPVADLVLHREFVADAEDAIGQLAGEAGNTVSIVGTVWPVPPRRSWDSMDRSVSISAAVLSGGEHRGTYHKVLLPTHGAYDEGKNFAPGDRPDELWRIGDVLTGVCICEDLWSGDGPPEAQSAAGARILFAPNASPWHRGKPEGRLELASRVAHRNGLPLVYVNLVGGQDELVFDGGSLVLDGDGEVLHRAAEYEEDRFVLDVALPAPRSVTGPVTTVHTRPVARRAVERRGTRREAGRDVEQVWQALVTGTRDFARANGFGGVVLGLSGGIDAAVTAAVAADALGAEQVRGIAMPAPQTPEHELADARQLADALGVELQVLSLQELLDASAEQLGALGVDMGTAGDHLARTRAGILSAVAEQEGRLLLATGNKTELSIGGAALHGDLVGGFAPLRDCPKTLLYELARHRNTVSPCIPERILSKTTTAQRHDDTLPSYEELDAIVEGYIERGQGLEDLVRAGFEPGVVLTVLRRVDDAELKRRQTPLGVKITPRAFGTDRRMPISNAWRPHRRSDAPDLPAATGAGVRLEPEAPSETNERVPA